MNIQDNLRIWDRTYTWPQEGDEWSARWGGSRLHWYVGILPRIHRFLPTGTVLEIGPGRGRWTQFLQAHCRTLLAVDLSPSCVSHCRARFGSLSHVSFHVNDGMSLAVVEDESVDFAFSFDSLVHAEPEVMESYVRQLARKLRPGASAFLHHSNAGDYRAVLRWGLRFQRLLRGARVLGLVHHHHRSLRMTATLMRRYCAESGLLCVSQEIIPWGRTLVPIDCLTVLARPASAPHAPCRIVRNMRFMREASIAAALARTYGC